MANKTLNEEKQFCVYIMTNKYRNVLYTGVTSDLRSRVFQHKAKMVAGFTQRYNLNKLVYFEEIENALDAIKREKQLKSGSRQKKIDLINKANPEWQDLYNRL